MADLATRFPTSMGFEAVNFQINTPSQSTETMSGKMRRINMGVSYYTWEVKFPNLLPLDAGTVNGFVAQAFGPQFSFEIILPENLIYDIKKNANFFFYPNRIKMKSIY
jgi:hypothetical protein